MAPRPLQLPQVFSGRTCPFVIEQHSHQGCVHQRCTETAISRISTRLATETQVGVQKSSARLRDFTNSSLPRWQEARVHPMPPLEKGSLVCGTSSYVATTVKVLVEKGNVILGSGGRNWSNDRGRCLSTRRETEIWGWPITSW